MRYSAGMTVCVFTFWRSFLMNRMSLYTLGFASALVYASTAVAQGTAAPAPATTAGTPMAMASKPFSFGVLGGATVPTGNLSDDAGTGWHLGAFVAADRGWPISFRLEGVYHSFGTKDQSGDGVTIHEQPSLMAGTLNGVWNFPVGGEIQPYLIAGFGIYRFSDNSTCSSTTAGACNDLAGSGSNTRMGINGGVGVNFHLSRFSTFVEARVHQVFTEGESSQMIPISVGIRF